MITPTLTGSAPILLVKDVVASAHYYRDRLGFHYDRFWGEPPNFCILTRDAMHVMLNQVEHEQTVLTNSTVLTDAWDIYFWVNDVDALFEDLQRHNTIIHTGLCNQPYGCRECTVHDLDSHLICFGQVLDPASIA